MCTNYVDSNVLADRLAIAGVTGFEPLMIAWETLAIQTGTVTSTQHIDARARGYGQDDDGQGAPGHLAAAHAR